MIHFVNLKLQVKKRSKGSLILTCVLLKPTCRFLVLLKTTTTTKTYTQKNHPFLLKTLLTLLLVAAKHIPDGYRAQNAQVLFFLDDKNVLHLTLHRKKYCLNHFHGILEN